MHLPRITIISTLLGIALAMPHQQLRDSGFDLFPPMPLAQPAASSSSSSSSLSSPSSAVSSSPSGTSTALTIPYGSSATHSADLVPARIKHSSTDVSKYVDIHDINDIDDINDSNGLRRRSHRRLRRRGQPKRRCPKKFILTRGYAIMFSIFAGFFIGIELTFWLAKLGPVSVLVSLVAGVVVALAASGIFYAIIKHTVMKKYGITAAGKRALVVRKLCAGAAARGLDCRRLSEEHYQQALKTIRTQSPVKVGPGGCVQKAAKKKAALV